jgi:hypothetical protein
MYYLRQADQRDQEQKDAGKQKWKRKLAREGQNAAQDAAKAVDCPVCGQRAKGSRINQHIDSGCWDEIAELEDLDEDDSEDEQLTDAGEVEDDSDDEEQDESDEEAQDDSDGEG